MKNCLAVASSFGGSICCFISRNSRITRQPLEAHLMTCEQNVLKFEEDLVAKLILNAEFGKR